MSVDQQQAETIRNRLHERAAQLRDEIQQTMERSSEESHVRIAEQARDNEDDAFSNLIVDVNLSEMDRDTGELRRIDSALVRLSNGTYGMCIDCSQTIPDPRLDAEPTANRCVDCQGLYEKTHAGVSTPSM